MFRPILAATALSIAVMPAFAASTESFEMRVDIDRAALETTEGANREFTKLSEDVHDRCVAESAEWPFSSRYAVSFCETRTLKAAVATINDPNLTVVYEASQAK